ncbi:PREDICTED: protein ASPARTIC PROTEASE IN GUARD CELL 1-like [Fragaria vesca subsp. vesca]
METIACFEFIAPLFVHDQRVSLETSEPDSDPSSLSLPLHHLDALSSNQTPSQLFHLRLRRDSLRFNSLTSLAYNRTRPGPPSSGFSSSIVSGLSQGSGEYFTRIGVGSSPKYLYMVLDTGSEVVWLQCAPCKRCYSQTDPIFDPRKSSFSSLPCSSPLCCHLDSLGCSSKSKTCLYQVSYDDDSFTFGDFSTETLTFRRSKVPKVALGCGHDNEGLFVASSSALPVRLAEGPAKLESIELVSQSWLVLGFKSH